MCSNNFVPISEFGLKKNDVLQEQNFVLHCVNI